MLPRTYAIFCLNEAQSLWKIASVYSEKKNGIHVIFYGRNSESLKVHTGGAYAP
jgi:hypothetical protein